MFRHEAKSLALFRAIREKMERQGPEGFLRAALEWAQHFAAQRPEDIWLAEWVRILDDALHSPEALARMYVLMTSTDEHAIDMRQSSPFPMVLTTAERTRVLLDFQEAWARGER